jgi:hypothetical protein
LFGEFRWLFFDLASVVLHFVGQWEVIKPSSSIQGK